MNFNWEWKHTIHALATPLGTSALAIVRVSGPDANRILRSCCDSLPDFVDSHTARLCFFSHPETKKKIDQVILTYFDTGRSFTGESSFEVTCHGSLVVIGEICEALLHAGSVDAMPGEFSFRAFCNGKLDLVQAETIQDLIMAQSVAQKDLHLNNLRGGFSSQIKEIKEELVKVVAHLEARLDFDEDDLSPDSNHELVRILGAIESKVKFWIDNSKSAQALREAPRICIFGRPNVGKSTLFNLLLNQDRSIVHERAGTTRDFIEDDVFVQGYRVLLQDTAGIRETSDEIENIGVVRAKGVVKVAFLKLLVVDLSTHDTSSQLQEFMEHLDERTIVVLNKADSVGSVDVQTSLSEIKKVLGSNFSRTVVGHRSDPTMRFEIFKLISSALVHASALSSEVHVGNREIKVLSEVARAISASILELNQHVSEELVIPELMNCISQCNKILGLGESEEVINRIFKEFCLGK